MSLAESNDPLFAPIPGADAFRADSPSAEASRAGLLLAMSTYAFGTDSAAADIRADADELGAPQLRPWADFSEDPWDQGRIDEYTDHVLEGYGERFDETSGDPDIAAGIMDGFARGSNPSALIALLNLRQRSDSPVEAVAAAAGLRAYSGESLALSEEILERHLSSEDELAHGIATATLGAAPPPPQTEIPDPRSGGPVRSAQVSTTVHGTWGLVTDAADSLQSRQGRQRFDPRKLPHFAVVRSWKHPDAWFSHSFYVSRENWERFDLANIVATRHNWV
jgi:hypothetical protein